MFWKCLSWVLILAVMAGLMLQSAIAKPAAGYSLSSGQSEYGRITGAKALSNSSDWEWQNPLPQGNSLNDVWGSSITNIFAVGSLGTILHFDGIYWSVSESGTTNDLYAVWGCSANAVFAVGDAGTILFFDGNSWSAMDCPVSTTLYDIWGFSPADIYAVSDRSTILHYDGNFWNVVAVLNLIAADTEISIYGIWGSSSTDVFAVGSQSYLKGGVYYQNSPGVVLHYDGNTWSIVKTISSFLRGIWGTSSSDVFAAGLNGSVLHYDGQDWSVMDTRDTGNLRSIFGRSESDVFALGSNGGLLHYDGTSWCRVQSDSGWSFCAAWGDNSALFAVGDGGLIVRFDSSQAVVSSNAGSAAYLNEVWGSSPLDVFAVGRAGTILHYDGSSWSNMNSPASAALACVWGSSATDVFAAPSSHNASTVPNQVPSWAAEPALIHYDGLSWSSISRLEVLSIDGSDWFDPAQGFTGDINGIWGSSSSDVYAVGSYFSNGIILHFDGHNWKTIQLYPSYPFFDIWGSSASDIFVVGTGGKILHYDGTTWNEMTSGIWDYLDSVWGSSGSDVYAAYSWLHPSPGAASLDPNQPVPPPGGPVILHYDGTSWEPMPVEDEFVDLSGTSATDVYAVGRYGQIWHYDGVLWTPMESPTDNFLFGVCGLSSSDVYAVGQSGTILHRSGQIGNRIYPDRGPRGASLEVNLTGSRLSEATALNLGDNVTVSGFQIIDNNRIKASIEIGSGALPGPRSASLTSPGGELQLGIFTIYQNKPPRQPVNRFPDGVNVNLLANLQISYFADPDGDDQAASQWQISEIPGDYTNPLFDSDVDTVNLLFFAAPRHLLKPSAAYYWRMRCQDQYGAWSEWSEESAFTTTPGWARFRLASTSYGPTDVAMTDVDGDGLKDMVAIDRDKNDLSWYKAPPGLQGAWIKSEIDPNFYGPRLLCLKDLDADGKDDIVVSGSSGLAWYKAPANAEGTWSKYPVNSSLRPGDCLSTGDLNGDNRTDLVTATGSNPSDVVWFEAPENLSGAWTLHTLFHFQAYTTNLAVADMDGDGDEDVVSTGGLGVFWFEAQAGGIWQKHLISESVQMDALEIADFNADGRPDVAAGSSHADVLLWYVAPAGNPGAWTEHIVDSQSVNDLSILDVDKDGRVDIVSANRDDFIWYRNPGDASDGWRKCNIDNYSLSPRGPRVTDIDLDDIDSDGRWDIAAVTYSVIYWYECPTDPAALALEQVVIGDPALAKRLASVLDKQIANIHKSDLEALTDLDLGGLNISDLSGLQYCSNLQTLNLRQNNIVDLTPLSALTHLTSLYLSHNQVADISPLAGLSALNLLYLDNNRIADLAPLVTISNLEVLLVNQNLIQTLPSLSGLDLLTSLDLSGNQIEDLAPLNRLSRLKVLGINDMQISDISQLQGNPRLEALAAANNRISDIQPLSNLTNLSWLDLAANPVTNFSELSSLPYLTHLCLNDSLVADTTFFNRLFRLEYLFLERCGMSDVGFLQSLPNLEYLYLDGNQITDISALENLPGLGWNNVSHVEPTSVSQIFKYLGETRQNISIQVSLAGNLISDIGPLVRNTHLSSRVSLDLTANPLSQESILDYIPRLTERGVQVLYGFKVIDISATTANGRYTTGDVVDILITYSDVANVNTAGGTPGLTLNSGGSALYYDGSGTNTLVFRYIVGPGQNSYDLDYQAADSLVLHGGTIKDRFLQDADNTLPPKGTFAAGHGIVIDTLLQAVAGPYPNSGLPGSTFDLEIVCNKQIGSAQVSFSGGGIKVNRLYLMTGGEQTWIRVNISIDPQAAAGIRDVTVILPDGTFVLYSGFTVIDVQPPSVISVSPLDGSTGLAANTKFSVVFTEPMRTATLNTASVRLAQNTTLVSGVVAYDETSKTVVFTPSFSLAYGTTYTATVSREVTDTAGNPLAADFSWRFTTANWVVDGGGGGSSPVLKSVSLNGLVSKPVLQTNSSGTTQGVVQLKTPDGKVTLDIPNGTRLLSAANSPLASLTAAALTSPPAAGSGQALVLAYTLGPEGAKFDPTITLSVSYDPALLPDGVEEQDLYLAFYDGTQWQSLAGTLDAQAKKVSVKISHFSVYALLGKITEPSVIPPTPTPSPSPSATPTPTVTSSLSPTPAAVPAQSATPLPSPTVTRQLEQTATISPSPQAAAETTQSSSTAALPDKSTNWPIVIIIAVAVIAVVLTVVLIVVRKPKTRGK